MSDFDLKRLNYDENILKVLSSNIDRIFAYWYITEEYNNSFKEKFGEDFFEKTKAYLIVKNLNNKEEEKIELDNFTNNYYIKIRYMNTFFQVELVRLGKEDNKDYGYRLVSNIIQSANIKIGFNYFDNKNIKIKNIKTGLYEEDLDFKKEEIEELYNKDIIPAWTQYKQENGYRE